MSLAAITCTAASLVSLPRNRRSKRFFGVRGGSGLQGSKETRRTWIATHTRRASFSLPAFYYAGSLFSFSKVGPKLWYGIWLTRPSLRCGRLSDLLSFFSFLPSIPLEETLDSDSRRSLFHLSRMPFRVRYRSVSCHRGHLNFVDDLKLSKMREFNLNKPGMQ